MALAALAPVLFAVSALRGDDAPPATQPAAQPPSVGQLIAPWTPNLPGPDDDDPIVGLSHQTKSIVGDMSDDHTDKPVQVKEQRVVHDLDELIKQLEKQTSGSGGGSANPSTPLSKSMIAKGPGGQGPLHDPKAGTHVWGQLPPKDRAQIEQSQTEGFPPGYESVLSNYYSRLAQGQANSDSGGGTSGDGGAAGHTPAPTTQP